MAYKLSSGLTADPTITEIADFWEIECLKKADHTVSLLDIAKSRGIVEDTQEADIDEQEAEAEEEHLEVIGEIDRRIKSCSNKYPFSLDDHNVLSINGAVEAEALLIYIYLLLATRNNMTANKIVGGIDGTLIFEKLSKDILANYLGLSAKGLTFGTASEGNFITRLQELSAHLNDGIINTSDNHITYNPQDDKLDVVAWIPFNDMLPSKLICFGQCKTGTSWIGTLEQLNVSSFLKKWFTQHPVINPVRTFLITDVLNQDDFYNRSVNNLFLDRCRITSLAILPDDNDWFGELHIWTSEIMNQFNLSF